MADANDFVNDMGPRHEKSLGLLTTRFVSLLQDAKDGLLDLKVVNIVDQFGITRPIHAASNN